MKVNNTTTTGNLFIFVYGKGKRKYRYVRWVNINLGNNDALHFNFMEHSARIKNPVIRPNKWTLSEVFMLPAR